MSHNNSNPSAPIQSSPVGDLRPTNQIDNKAAAPNATGRSWVLITGASSGFGEEFARQYAEQGHALVLVARRLDRLRKLAEALRQQFRIEVVVEQVDLSDVAAVTDWSRGGCTTNSGSGTRSR